MVVAVEVLVSPPPLLATLRQVHLQSVAAVKVLSSQTKEAQLLAKQRKRVMRRARRHTETRQSRRRPPDRSQLVVARPVH